MAKGEGTGGRNALFGVGNVQVAEVGHVHERHGLLLRYDSYSSAPPDAVRTQVTIEQREVGLVALAEEG